MTWVDCEGAGRPPAISLSPVERVCPVCRRLDWWPRHDGLIGWHQRRADDDR